MTTSRFASSKMLKMDGPNIPINKLFDSKKLREFTYEQKRHTIRRSIAPRFERTLNNKQMSA